MQQNGGEGEGRGRGGNLGCSDGGGALAECKACKAYSLETESRDGEHLWLSWAHTGAISLWYYLPVEGIHYTLKMLLDHFLLEWTVAKCDLKDTANIMPEALILPEFC
jgi:hypothetical protein